MSQSVLLKAAGLYTFPNRLSSVPNGALLRALNIIINRDNIIESRRGFKIYGSAMGADEALTSHQLTTYKGRLIRHYGTSSGTTLQYDSNGTGTFSSFSGTYAETEAGLRIKSLEANSNFYFTTSDGIKKISTDTAANLSTATIGNAGGLKGLDLKTSLNSTTGFFTQESTIAYRIVWGVRDTNQNLILGSPSERSVIYNPLTGILVKDFNNLLTVLDSCNNSGGINDANYVTTLKLATNATASTLRTSLITLTTKLDNDTVITEGAIDTATATVAGNVASLVFNSTVAAFLEIGDQITISGLTGVGDTADLNGTHILTGVSTTTVTFALTHGNFGPTADTGGSVKRLKYTLISQPAALSSTPTTTELEAVQDYYDAIVTDLQNELSGICTGSLFNSSSATTSSTVNLTFTVPSGTTTAYFYQVYRTALTTSSGVVALSSLDPGDETQLVFEDNPTSAQISAGYVTIQDITPDAFRGANLYTNPNTGDGILQANEVPPLAKDIASFKSYTFYANTQTKQRLNLSLLSISQLVSDVSTITITDGSTSNTYTFVSGVAEVTDFSTVADVANNLNGKYFLINSANDENLYYVWYKTSGGATTDPAVSGRTGIRVDVTTGDTANTVATATRAKLNQNNNFTITGATNHVIITNNQVGVTTNGTVGTSGFSVSITTPGTGEDVTNKKILISSLASVAQQVDETARSLERVINRNTSEIIYVYYLSGPTDVPGLLLFEARTLGGAVFYTSTNSSTTSSQFNPDLYHPAAISNISVANPTVITSNAHGLTSGNQIIISGSNSTPIVDGTRTVTVIDANSFSVPVNVTISGNRGGWLLVSNANDSDNEVSPNRIYYSKVDQPEAVPIVNYLDVGPKDKSILRILALRDNLFILKEEGVYRLSGLIAPFTVSLFDSSTNLNAPDSAAVLNNLIYCYTTQGVARISDTGVEIISRPIEDLLLKLTIPSYTNFTTATFGVGYESDRSYYLWTVTDPTDIYATQCFRFNTFTNTWVESDKAVRCAVVNPSDDKMYIAPTDTNYIEQERKSFDRTDYSDREISTTISAVSTNIVDITTVTNVSIGDVIVQTQYLTIKQFNQLLTKLDRDVYLTDQDYYSTLAAVAGDTLNTKLDSVISKIAADAGRTGVAGATAAGTYTALSPVSSTFSAIQTAFNNLINLLNVDVGIGSHNYLTSSGTIIQETIITDIDATTNQVTTEFSYPFISGPAIVYNHIQCLTQWVPQYMQDVSMSKQVSEGTMIFEDSSFSSAIISYASDLNPSFFDIEFNGNGNGTFGNNFYGQGIYGGNGSGIPFRTYVPREKQRCRYLNCKFTHTIAREIFAVYGLSLTYNMVSQKAYR